MNAIVLYESATNNLKKTHSLLAVYKVRGTV